MIQSQADQNNTMRFTWAFGYVYVQSLCLNSVTNDNRWSLYGFWTIVLGLGVIHRATSRARTPSTQNISSLPRAESASPRNKRSRIGQLSSRVECDLLLPYLFGDGSSNAFLGGTIPTRIETLVIVLYAVVNFIFLFPGYHSFSGNIK